MSTLLSTPLGDELKQ